MSLSPRLWPPGGHWTEAERLRGPPASGDKIGEAPVSIWSKYFRFWTPWRGNNRGGDEQWIGSEGECLMRFEELSREEKWQHQKNSFGFELDIPQPSLRWSWHVSYAHKEYTRAFKCHKDQPMATTVTDHWPIAGQVLPPPGETWLVAAQTLNIPRSRSSLPQSLSKFPGLANLGQVWQVWHQLTAWNSREYR